MATLKGLNKKLNLVVELEGYGDQPIYVHSTPISREVFETHYQVLSMTFTEVMRHQGAVAGPKIAMLALTDVAKAQNLWEGRFGVREALIPEIRRLTNVIAPVNGRWSAVPLDNAINSDTLTPDDVAEVENAVAFFIVTSALTSAREGMALQSLVMKYWSLRFVSSDCSAFLDGLPKLTTKEDAPGIPTPDIGPTPEPPKRSPIPV